MHYLRKAGKGVNNLENYISWNAVRLWRNVSPKGGLKNGFFRGLCNILMGASYGYVDDVTLCIDQYGSLCYRYQGNYYLTIKQLRALSSRFWFRDANRPEIVERAHAIADYYDECMNQADKQFWKSFVSVFVSIGSLIGSLFTGGALGRAATSFSVAAASASNLLSNPNSVNFSWFVEAFAGAVSISDAVVYDVSAKSYYYFSDYDVNDDGKCILKSGRSPLKKTSVDGEVVYSRSDSGVSSSSASSSSSLMSSVTSNLAGLDIWQKLLLISCAGGLILSALMKKD